MANLVRNAWDPQEELQGEDVLAPEYDEYLTVL